MYFSDWTALPALGTIKATVFSSNKILSGRGHMPAKIIVTYIPPAVSKVFLNKNFTKFE